MYAFFILISWLEFSAVLKKDTQGRPESSRQIRSERERGEGEGERDRQTERNSIFIRRSEMIF